jgi:hypothetical protein
MTEPFAARQSKRRGCAWPRQPATDVPCQLVAEAKRPEMLLLLDTVRVDDLKMSERLRK